MTDATKRRTEIAIPSGEAIARGAAILRAGGLVAMPTETVYGLAGDATSERAVAAIYAAKERPVFNPLIAHVLDIEAARAEALFDADALALAQAFWPGPLTLIAPAAPQSRISLLARAGLGSVALRAPSHPAARALIGAAGVPLVAPSANRSGRVSPTLAAHVLADLDGRVDLILDAGPTKLGVESTIVACLDGAPRLLRHGAITLEAIEAVLGRTLGAHEPAPGAAPLAPGLLASHYAPRAALRLEARDAAPVEAALDFGGALAGSTAGARLDLSPTSDLVEAAANLFAFLRTLDETGLSMIAAAPIPETGLGAAINDRLRRAAAPRGTP
ncbi:L-threonylcarbamoyladenylate synthase [Methylocapsa sp. S129]|uniref:L-threonylcarbamoyladenylate synthase n=1 Tax=Methylocapsa sp. S129 TaxID=1641869 RepID=UPI00131C3DF8|nr:L-threonylcarbamoyladenylate synthase [Methylocapsa sp. S129]